MSCPENPADCQCPPPGGGGKVVPPWLLISGMPHESGWTYLPWETPATLAFRVTSGNSTQVDGHIIAQDGLFKRLNAPVAQSQSQVDSYLSARTTQLAKRAEYLANARQLFQNQAGVPWPDYPGGGIVLNEDGPFMIGDKAIFIPFSYPGAKCLVFVLRTDPVTVEAIFPEGRRTIRNVQVMHKGSEWNEFQRLQGIWVPLYQEAIADVDSDYPVPA